MAAPRAWTVEAVKRRLREAERAATRRPPDPALQAALRWPDLYIDETLQFHPEWVVDKIAPRPILFITTDDDRLVPPEESRALYDKAGEPKSLITLKGFGHYEVYAEPAFSAVMEPTLAWFERHLPAHLGTPEPPRQILIA